MYVRVHLFWRHGQKQGQPGVAATRHEVAIGCAHRTGEQLVSHRAAVDNEIELKAVRAVKRRQPSEALDGGVTARRTHGKCILDEVLSQNTAKAGKPMIDQARLARI